MRSGGRTRDAVQASAVSSLAEELAAEPFWRVAADPGRATGPLPTQPGEAEILEVLRNNETAMRAGANEVPPRCGSPPFTGPPMPIDFPVRGQKPATEAPK